MLMGPMKLMVKLVPLGAAGRASLIVFEVQQDTMLTG